MQRLAEGCDQARLRHGSEKEPGLVQVGLGRRLGGPRFFHVCFRSLPDAAFFGHVFGTFSITFFSPFFQVWRLPGQVYFTFFSRFFGAYMVTFVSRFP